VEQAATPAATYERVRRAVQGKRRGIEMEADSIVVSDSVTSGRWKRMTTLTSEPGRQRHREKEGRGSQGEAACGFGWAGPLRLAGEKLGPRAAEAEWAKCGGGAAAGFRA
jgi:hypothetical protein